MHTADADAMADRCRNLLFRQFPKTRYGVLAKVETPAMVAPDSSARMPSQSDPAVK
jgi:hypothetical protein